jgi:hypothetical protein
LSAALQFNHAIRAEQTMQFWVTGDVFLEEVSGDEVIIEAMRGERFALHRPHSSAYELDPLWLVSHVETGMRVGGGDSIEAALRAAEENCAGRSPEEIELALTHARERRAKADASKPVAPAQANQRSVL